MTTEIEIQVLYDKIEALKAEYEAALGGRQAAVETSLRQEVVTLRHEVFKKGQLVEEMGMKLAASQLEVGKMVDEVCRLQNELDDLRETERQLVALRKILNADVKTARLLGRPIEAETEEEDG